MKHDKKPIEGMLIVLDCQHKKVVYREYGKWLYPLFHFDAFLSENPTIDKKNLYVMDAIIGKGAAVLLINMGITHCYGHVMSEGAIDLLEKHHISFQYDQKVEGIFCQTEKIIDNNATIPVLYEMLLERKK